MSAIIADAAIIFWVPIAIILFRRLHPITAATIVFLGGAIILPVGVSFDFPGLPPIDRKVVASLAAIVGYVFCVPGRLKLRRGVHWPEKLVFILAITGFFTVLANSDTLQYGPRFIPGLKPWDALSGVFFTFMLSGVPFFIGARLVKNYEDLEVLFRAFVIFGLIYLPLIAWEVRMSPQLHATLYGHFPHSFAQHIRGDGYRPVGFTSHGLELALFMSTSLIAALGLAKARIKLFNLPQWMPSWVLMIGLLLCKSAASIFYGFLTVILMIFTKIRLQVKIILILALVVVSYPILRSQDLFPVDTILQIADSVSDERRRSLTFRFDNEALLLEKARERIWFGWGSWGRHHIFDPITGRDLSVIDGYWVILIGQLGVVGFLSFFLLILTPIVLVARKLKNIPPGNQRILVVTLLLMVLIRAIDLLPNAFFSPITLFLAGALYQFTLISKKPSVTQVHS